MNRFATCGEAIPEPRLLAIPFTLTCSAACDRQRDLWRKRKAAKRARERRKVARDKPFVPMIHHEPELGDRLAFRGQDSGVHERQRTLDANSTLGDCPDTRSAANPRKPSCRRCQRRLAT